MLANWWLILVAVIMILLIVALILYLVILFSSVEDKNQAWFPKVIVVIGLSLACFTVLLLPFDVANRKNPTQLASVGAGINTALIWQILLWAIAVFTVVIVPFATFYYEAWDPERNSIVRQCGSALVYTFLSVLIFTILLITLWLTVGNALIPYRKFVGTPQLVVNIQTAPSVSAFVPSTLKIPVSIFVYMVGLLSAIGWVAFVFFGGVGLTSLPLDLVLEWIHRPKPISLDEYVRRKDRIAECSTYLMEVGRKLEEAQRSGSSGRSTRRKVNLFKAQVLSLEEKYENLEISYKDKGGSPILAFLKLILGIISVGLSIAWGLHIIFSNLIGITPFLNTMFIWLDNIFSLFGVLAYGIFSFYLLWVVIKGLFVVGVRLLFFKIHPMKINDTLMNSFLFNTMVVLICSITVTQFCAMSFRSYASNTTVDTIFSTYVQQLQGLGYIVTYFQYGLLVVMLISMIWACVCTHRKRKQKGKDEFDL